MISRWNICRSDLSKIYLKNNLKIINANYLISKCISIDIVFFIQSIYLRRYLKHSFNIWRNNKLENLLFEKIKFISQNNIQN